MRIAVGQLWQESNTFNPLPTTRADFDAEGVLRGDAVVEQMATTNELGGFIQSLRGWPEKPDIVGLVRLPCWPAGAATAETFTWLRQEMLDAVDRAGPIDAVLLALHGALVAEGEPDVEGAVLEAVRQLIGPGVPLVATLDLHASITRRMVRSADALVLYHTAPHIDIFETGQRGAGVLGRMLFEGARPVTAFQRVPMVAPADRANTQDPESVSYGLCRRLRELEAEPGILAAGLATVQPWLDIPDLGSAVVVVGTDEERARRACADLASELWQHRGDYLSELVSVEDAVSRASAACQSGLVVLSDCADATTSGSPGDSTHLLRELLKLNWPRPALVTMVDPELVAQLAEVPLNSHWAGPLGGRRDHRFSEPISVNLRLARRFEARFVLSGHLGNLPIDMGPSVVLASGNNVRVVVTSRPGPHFAPELFRQAGFDPFDASVLVAKSPCGFRAAYQERAALILVVSAPGCAPADFWKYEYRKIDRPLWPWDDFAWRPAPEVLRRSGE
jgi:microcystin degradation protein MlrC